MSNMKRMQRRGFLARLAGLAVAGVAGPRLWAELPGGMAPTPITVYKSSTCGCCTKWVDHLRANGFAPVVHDHEEMEALKDEMGVPKESGPATPASRISISSKDTCRPPTSTGSWPNGPRRQAWRCPRCRPSPREWRRTA